MRFESNLGRRCRGGLWVPSRASAPLARLLEGTRMERRLDKNKRRAFRPRPPFRIVEGAGTEPFQCLSPEAVWTLLRLYAKFNGYNRADLSCTFNEVKDTMSGRVFSRALWQLIGFGFIDVRQFGRLERTCSIFSLSDRWRRLCGVEAAVRRGEIGNRLEEIERLKRERWPSARQSEKRQRIAALRKRVFEA